MYSRCAMTIAISIRCDGFVDQNSPNDTRHNSVTRHTAECVPLPAVAINWEIGVIVIAGPQWRSLIDHSNL